MSETVTMTLTEFLLARYAEDEAGYRAEAAGIEWLSVNGRDLWPQLLADIEAKRRIVELHTAPPWIMRAFTSPVDGSSHPERIVESDTCPMCAEAVGYLGDEHEPYPCDTLKALASVYADHPEFRQEWAL